MDVKRSSYLTIFEHAIRAIMATTSTSVQGALMVETLLVYLGDTFIKELKKAAVDEV